METVAELEEALGSRLVTEIVHSIKTPPVVEVNGTLKHEFQVRPVAVENIVPSLRKTKQISVQ